VGGFITTYFSWHWIFLINVPIGAAWHCLLVQNCCPASPPRRATAPLDCPASCSGLAASGIVFGLSVISLPALPPWVGIATRRAGVVCGACSICSTQGAPPHPVLNLEGLCCPTRPSRRGHRRGDLFRIGIGGVPFLLPLMLQLGFGYTPFQSGLLTFASALGAIAMKLATARLFRK
jgi:hypothetical protein